jgi:ankyrin repeat protein
MFNAVDNYGQTGLHWAASNNDFDNAKDLIEKMSVDEICLCNFDNKYTALHLAAQKGAVKIINLLLGKGHRILACKVDRYGQTALHWCSDSREHFQCAEALVQIMEPEDLSIQTNDNKYTVLHLAAQKGVVKIINLLLEKGQRTLACKVDWNGQTALHWCSFSREHFQSAEALVQIMESEDLSIQNYDNNYTVLHLAAQGENILLINLLMAKGGHELACKIDIYGQTALHWSVSKGNYQACLILYKYMEWSDINKKAQNGKTARDYAIAKNYSEIISLLTKS